jgi:hypothetical protein
MWTYNNTDGASVYDNSYYNGFACVYGKNEEDEEGRNLDEAEANADDECKIVHLEAHDYGADDNETLYYHFYPEDVLNGVVFSKCLLILPAK